MCVYVCQGVLYTTYCVYILLLSCVVCNFATALVVMCLLIFVYSFIIILEHFMSELY